MRKEPFLLVFVSVMLSCNGQLAKLFDPLNFGGAIKGIASKLIEIPLNIVKHGHHHDAYGHVAVSTHYSHGGSSQEYGYDRPPHGAPPQVNGYDYDDQSNGYGGRPSGNLYGEPSQSNGYGRPQPGNNYGYLQQGHKGNGNYQGESSGPDRYEYENQNLNPSENYNSDRYSNQNSQYGNNEPNKYENQDTHETELQQQELSRPDNNNYNSGHTNNNSNQKYRPGNINISEDKGQPELPYHNSQNEKNPQETYEFNDNTKPILTKNEGNGFEERNNQDDSGTTESFTFKPIAAENSRTTESYTESYTDKNPKVTTSDRKTTIRPIDDEPLLVPLNPNEYTYEGDKVQVAAPKRNAEEKPANPIKNNSQKQEIEEEDFDIDVRFDDS